MKKLAIVGSHSATRHLAPFDDPDYEIWVFNEAAMNTPEYYPDNKERQWCKRWNVCFQLHNEEVYASKTNWVDNRHWEWLQKDHGRNVIYMQKEDERIPSSMEYPLETILAMTPRKQITSSVSYALALALHCNEWVEIGVWGVELSSNSEYAYQIPNWMYWIGYADGMGVDLVLHSGDVHFADRLYGYEGELQIPLDYYADRAKYWDDAFEQSEKETSKLQRKIKDHILNKKMKHVSEWIIQLRNMLLTSGAYSGACKEAKNYNGRTDVISRQEFEIRAAQAQKDGEQLTFDMHHEMGKLEYVLNAYMQTYNLMARAQLLEFTGNVMRLSFDAGIKNGIYRENLEYIKEYDERTQATGGIRTLKALGVENGNN